MTTDALTKLQQTHGTADPALLKEGAPVSGSGTEQYPEPVTTNQAAKDNKPDVSSLREHCKYAGIAMPEDILKGLRKLYKHHEDRREDADNNEFLRVLTHVGIAIKQEVGK